MLFFLNLPEPSQPTLRELVSEMYREDAPDYRVADPVRAVHRKSANRQPAIIFAPRHAQPSPNACRRSKLPCAGSKALTRRCESPVRHRVRFPPLATSLGENFSSQDLKFFAGLPEYEPLDFLPASPPPNLDFLVFAHVSSRPKKPTRRLDNG